MVTNQSKIGIAVSVENEPSSDNLKAIEGLQDYGEEEHMAIRDGYTGEEWQTLQFGPLWVFQAVAAADKVIDDKEAAALAKELQEGYLYKNALAREVLSSVAFELAEVMPAYNADTRRIDQGLEEVASLLDAKGESDAEGFKRALMILGKSVAEASGGGLLGIGSKTSDEETKALIIVASALRVRL